MKFRKVLHALSNQRAPPDAPADAPVLEDIPVPLPVPLMLPAVVPLLGLPPPEFVQAEVPRSNTEAIGRRSRRTGAVFCFMSCQFARTRHVECMAGNAESAARRRRRTFRLAAANRRRCSATAREKRTGISPAVRWKDGEGYRKSLPSASVRRNPWSDFRDERWKGTNFHGLNQAILQGEPMAHVFVHKNGSSQVAHDLMYVDQDAPIIFRVEGRRLDVRIDLAPLLRPVSADFFRPPDKAAFEGFRPSHVGGHEEEGGVNIPRVEGCVSRAEQFDF